MNLKKLDGTYHWIKNIQFEEAIEQLASMDGTEFNEWSKGAHSYGKQLVNDKSSIAQNSLLFS